MSTPWDRAASLLHASELRIFGESVTWQSSPPLGATATVSVIWDAQQAPDRPQRATDTIWVRLSDFSPAPANDDQFTRGSKVYRVVGDSMPDDNGGSYLHLRRVS